MLRWNMFKRERRITLTISVRVVIKRDGDEYWGTAPALPGLFIDGDSIEQVKELLPEGILVYLESLYKNNEPVPVGPDFIVELKDMSVQLGVPLSIDDHHWAKTEWPIHPTSEGNLKALPQNV